MEQGEAVEDAVDLGRRGVDDRVAERGKREGEGENRQRHDTRHGSFFPPMRIEIRESSDARMENVSTRWFGDPAPSRLARSLWLRSLGLIFFSAFYSLWFQIHGLIGPHGILPAGEYLLYARQAVGAKAYWWIPSL